MTIEHTTLLLLAVAGFVVASSLRGRFRHEFIVSDGFAGLLYHEGRLVKTLAAGRHVRWGRNFRLTTVDVRRTLLQVPGQEVLSADHVGVKLSVVLTVQITDVARTVQAADNHVAHLYSAAKTAVRTVVTGVTLEALLSERLAIDEQLRELIGPQAEAVGVQLHAAEVRDVMLPGELRKAFSETLKARQEGQATLERARAESAALRSLANAARLLEGQPALATLRFLQTLETPGAGRALVMNDLAALLPALSAPSRKPGIAQAGET